MYKMNKQENIIVNFTSKGNIEFGIIFDSCLWTDELEFIEQEKILTSQNYNSELNPQPNNLLQFKNPECVLWFH